MVKTNSKIARANTRNYILNHFDADGYSEFGNIDVKDFKQVAKAIYSTFKAEKFYSDESYNTFEAWMAGLPSIIDSCYYYNRSAVDDLGAILEESETEKAKYTEHQAEQLLTLLIYREITKAL